MDPMSDESTPELARTHDDRTASSPLSGQVGGELLGQLLAEQNGVLMLTRSMVDHGQAVATLVARHRGELEGVAELGRRVETRLEEVAPSGRALMDVLERVKLLALNTGLEGARLGDAAGKALGGIAEEFRDLAAKGLRLTEELHTTLGLLAQEKARLAETVSRIQNSQLALADEVRQGVENQQRIAHDVAALGTHLAEVTGLDPSMVEHLSEIDHHARQLSELLAPLEGTATRPLLRSVLRPLTESLTRLTEREI